MADNSGLTGTPLGIAIAVISSFINGSTFVLQKKGILRSRDKGCSYLTDVVWCSGTLCSEYDIKNVLFLKRLCFQLNVTKHPSAFSVIIGQVGNFLAYNLAPAVIVTPLGALGVLFGAVLASWILEERLNVLGKLGCIICCCGSVVLIIHAPKTVATSRQELEDGLSDPVFVTYILLVVLTLVALIVWVVPAHGTSNIMVYVAICSLLGSFTVPSSKGLGLVAPDVFGEGQPSVGAVALFLGLLGVLAVSILIQFFFINKALECFSSNIFEAIYYVTFTSTVIFASALLFKEWMGLTVTDGLAMLCGLTTVCVGVILLRISQEAVINWKEKKEPKKTD
ncbi:magnesium transporter NIPA1 isoform X1 [Poecilia formosa]|uniref:magnesium transporter NIPA1 isoform X1 n=1 Tax=Poecilia formosa TaxID=48698 RepID=UPI0007BA52A8|nr:PREDICTED: magnesium transporter NIPA1 isoform X1 [Poecilia formosa]